jgi:hypothetical protein
MNAKHFLARPPVCPLHGRFLGKPDIEIVALAANSFVGK